MTRKQPSAEFFHTGTIVKRSAGEYILGWGERTWLDLPDSQDGRIHYYFPDFFLEKRKSWFTHAFNACLTTDELLVFLKQHNSGTPSAIPWEAPEEAFFKKEFRILQELFGAQKLEKAVIYLYESGDKVMSPALLSHCLTNALKYLQSRPAYLIGFWDNDEGCLSVTPELLFELKTNGNQTPQLRTVALGGTFFTDDLSMLQNEKLVEEHRIIVDSIIHNLAPYGNVHRSAIEALPFGKINHLLTKIHVDLKPHHIPSFMEIIKKMHPTPALGAFPREEGDKWLRRYQTLLDRRYYGAPAGYQWKEVHEAKCYVNIRNIQWNSDGILIAGGAGVIAKSDVGAEWTEIANKIKAIKEIFKID